MISLVVATDEMGLIGRNNELPWGRLSNDLRHFRKITDSKTVVMGRRTFESIGRPLPNRKNIVLSRTVFAHEGVEWYSSIEEVLELPQDIMIIGGANIYKQFLPHADKIYLTKILDKFEGDTYFPEVNWLEWNVDSISFAWKDENNKYDCAFMEFSRIKGD